MTKDTPKNPTVISDRKIKEVVTELVGERISREVVRTITEEVVHQTFTTLGIDTSDPYAFQRDVQYLRDFRLATEKMKSKGMLVMVGIVATAVCTTVWLGLKHLVLSQ